MADLDGKRIDIAGGPLDKSWLVLRAGYRARRGVDLIDDSEPVFAAPPLLSEQLRTGNLDAALTFWPYAARLETAGHRRLSNVGDLLRDLSISQPQALIGYVFRKELIGSNPAGLREVFTAVDRTNAVLGSSEEAWRRLRPVMKVQNNAEYEALKTGYRAGIPEPNQPPDIEAVGNLFGILVAVGGERLVGPGTQFDKDIFWDPKTIIGQ